MKIQSNMRAVSVLAALMVSSALTGVAHAQDSTPTGSDQASKAQGSQDKAQGSQDIVVTAQRRSESLQKVPISITAISPERAATLNIKDMSSLQLVTPDLVYSTGISYAQTYIRGIGSTFTNPGLEPAVATYIDGAYLERGFGTMLDIVDPASLQVLKGPQGTLWGRNATGGAMLINTADPDFKLAGNVRVEVGSEGHQNVDGMINIPLSDEWAVRFAARYRNDDGYIRNLVDGFMFGARQDWTVRGKIAFKPTGSPFSAVLEVQYDHTKRTPGPDAEFLPAAYCTYCGTSTYTYPISNPYTTVGNVLNGGVGGLDKNTFINLHMNYDAGSVSFSNVASYRKIDNFEAGDFDFTEQNGFNIAQQSGSRTFTEDLTATTKLAGIVNGVAGLSYLHDTSNFNEGFPPNNGFPNPTYAVTDQIKTESYSGFAEITVEPTPGLKLVGGGRYTHDDRSLYVLSSGAFVLGGSKSFDSFTPRFVVSYGKGPVNVYASYNQGFKAGGFNTPYFGGAPDYVNPEKIKSYEAGLKYVSPDRRLRANVAGFVYDYSNLQVTAVDQSTGGSVLQNAASATGKGVEVDMDYRPVRALQIFAGGTYLDAHYTSFTGAQVQYPSGPSGPSTGFADISGTPLVHSPRWTGFIGATLKEEVGNGWKADLTGLAHYSSSFYFAADGGGPLHADIQPAYTTVKLSGHIMPDDERYQIGFYVENLTNTLYYDFRFTAAPFGGMQFVARPRTYGLTLGVKF